MFSNLIDRVQSPLVRQLSDFLVANIDVPGTAWPRLPGSQPTKRSVRTAKCRARKLHVLVVGDLALELPVDVGATRDEVEASIGFDTESRLDHRWKMGRLRIGGFVGHVVRVASKLGAKVSVCTNIPVPVPRLIEEFFEEFAVDRRLVRGLPGRASVRVVARCTDGQAAFERPGITTAIPVDVPKAAACDVNAILADPCAFDKRTGISQSLFQCLERSSASVAVGLRLDHRSRDAELRLAQDERVWAFVREHDGRRLAEQYSQPLLLECENELVQRLHDLLGIAKLVVQLGAKGAVMLNGTPCPYRVHTCPVSPTEFTAPGDTLLTVTTLASAAGADDRTSLRRGVAAATGQAGGLELPVSFHELDAA